jgi:hypothetical protein
MTATPAAAPPRVRRYRAGRIALSLALIVAAAAFTAVWAIPNVAGAAFVHVRAVVTATAAPTGPNVTIGGAAAIQAGAVSVGVEIDNRYPLAVVVGTGPIAYQAAAYRRDPSGLLTRVWQVGAGDQALEEGSDSPAGGGTSSGAAVVPSGVTRHALTSGATAFKLTDATGAPLPAGVYYLRVWAYGIGSPVVALALDDGVDPLGPPVDLPQPTA